MNRLSSAHSDAQLKGFDSQVESGFTKHHKTENNNSQNSKMLQLGGSQEQNNGTLLHRANANATMTSYVLL